MKTVEIRRNTLGMIKGSVTRGRQVARKLGFPTANLQVEAIEGEFRLGVYGVIARYQGNQYEGVMNAGIRPTFTELQPAVHYEVHLLNFDQSIYGARLEVDVCFFVRDEMKFPRADQLTRQIAKDVQNVQKRFELLNSAEDEVHLTDFAFGKLCEDVYGINRGVYNTIETSLYARGLTHITKRRKAVLSFLEYLTFQKSVKRTSQIKFGNGGLTANLQEFCRSYLGGC
ncbi:riboflavin kinase [Brevibacillus massiliensis]|uniref:riboflavin kinase n=1 Tax=Brevibacillus massiliensis TaxID=1118054 RepID=UPI0002ED924F|nr:riboflavin kinase [Brevibacillus massiliensis]